jgi:DNA polymerase
VEPDLASFRTVARALLARDASPEQVLFEESRGRQASLLATQAVPEVAPRPSLAVPRAFLELAERVACHRDLERWALLYRVLWRLTHGERQLLGLARAPPGRS